MMDSAEHDDLDEPQETRLLELTNKLLDYVGISSKKVLSIDELVRVGSSLFVAVFESLFHVRVDGIVRAPKSREDYSFNAQLVIDSLSERIKMDFRHITGDSIVRGDLQSISNLVNILFRIVGLTQSASITGRTNDDTRDVIETFVSPQRSIFSISTHESDFIFEGDDSRVYGSPHARPSGGLRDSSRGQQLFRLDEKQHEAAVRRARLVKRRESATAAKNRAKRERSRRVLSAQRVDEARALEQAHLLRASNEEHVMLRRVYAGLLRKMHEWKRDDARESRERQRMAERDAELHMRSLEELFRDRVRLVQEQEADLNSSRDSVVKAQRKMLSELLASKRTQQEQLMCARVGALKQRRQHRQLARHDAHRDLLALLGAEDWADSLRHDPRGSYQKQLDQHRPRSAPSARLQ